MILNYYHISDESILDTKEFEPGSIYFCVSTGRLCLDTITGNHRVWVNENYIILSTETDREGLTNPIHDKLYIVLDSKSVYLYHNNEWSKLSSDNNSTINSTEVENIVNNILEEYKNNGDFNGTDGVGIQSVEQTVVSEESEGDNVLTVTLTNGNSTEFTVKNGKTGATPNISIGTVNTLSSESKATASISGTAENPILNLGIPKGATGAAGSSTSTDGVTIPGYVRTEAERVAALVQSRQNANSMTFIAGSDIHARLDYSAGSYTTTQMLDSMSHAAQAMKIITSSIHVDFVTLLGDFLWDSGESAEQAMNMFRLVYEYFNPAFRGIPQFWAEGNHDFLENPANGNIALTDAQVFTGIGIHNTGNIFDPDNRIQNYCYRDFDDFDIRVICLNTSDSAEYNVSNKQVEWLKTLLSEAKNNDKKVIILSHMPIDHEYKGTTLHNTVIEYEDIIIACIHGHIHNHHISVLTGTTKVARLGVPCINFYRTRGWDGVDESNPDNVFPKVTNTAEDTAFTVFTFDFDNNMIYADYYGAGCNRTFNMTTGEIIITAFFSITYELYNVSSSNTETSINTGSAYETTLVSTDGSAINNYTVIMNGIDVTDLVYSDGKINITEVTGNIIIRASTENSYTGGEEEETGSNLATLVAEALDSAEPYNGTGYKNDYRLTSGIPNESAASGYVMTGFINYTLPSTGSPDNIYIKGADLVDNDSNCRMIFFDSAKTKEVLWLWNGGSTGKISEYFTIDTLDNGYTKLSPIISDGRWIGWDNYTSVAKYFRISLKGSGENLNIYIGELPEEGQSEPNKYTITYNLTNVSSTNNTTIITSNESYNSTLSSTNSNDIKTIFITMGGTDITDSVYVDGVITIPEVTGNIIITATTESNEEETVGYTNLIPLSTTEMYGSTIFMGDNGEVGYKTNARFNSNLEHEDVEGMCYTGYMALPGGDGQSSGFIIRIKNIIIDGTRNAYLTVLNVNGTPSKTWSNDELHAATDDNGIICCTIPANGMYAIRLSCGVIDDTSILTINEEII